MGAAYTPANPLLAVRGLRVAYPSPQAELIAVSDVDLTIDRGEIVGLLGESGSGKSTLAAALLRCLPPAARVSGKLVYQDRELAALDEKQMRKLRGARIGFIFQDPFLALSPVIGVGEQVLEVLRAHRDLSRKEARRLVLEIFARLRFEDAERMYRSYPHQLSGGQCQRIVIAQALICKPDLIIADEPTASLDVETTLDIIKLLRGINQELSIAFLLISHDPAIVRALADRIVVLRDGKIVEQGTADEILNHPSHTYTKLLVGAGNGIVLDESSQLSIGTRCSKA